MGQRQAGRRKQAEKAREGTGERGGKRWRY